MNIKTSKRNGREPERRQQEFDAEHPLEHLRGGFGGFREDLRAMGFNSGVGAAFGLADVLKIGDRPAIALSFLDGALAGFEVHPDFRGNGLGTAFIRMLAKEGPLEVIDPNEKMLALLERVGSVTAPDGRGIVSVTLSERDRVSDESIKDETVSKTVAEFDRVRSERDLGEERER